MVVSFLLSFEELQLFLGIILKKGPGYAQAFSRK
jgi:hypothetical protein